MAAPADAADARRVRGRPRLVGRTPLLVGLAVALAAVALASVAVGAYGVSPVRTVAIVAGHLGLDVGVDYTQEADAVVWSIRIPRVLLGILVGAGLGVSGAALQGLFRNPLADPGLVGVSSGASLAAVGTIVLGLTAAGAFTLPIAAFLGSLAATLLVYALARHQGRTEVITLLLTGLAVNAIAGAGIGLFLFLADDEELRGAIFWTLGSLGTATWDKVEISAPFVLVGTLAALTFARPLNLLALGEREARHLGLATERTRFAIVVCVALATGAATAVAGIVGFVGLIVPHLVRLAAGPDHRVVLPGSALGGATILLLADIVARTIAAPAELPLGVVTSLLGGPFFLYLLHRTRREHGGWA